MVLIMTILDSAAFGHWSDKVLYSDTKMAQKTAPSLIKNMHII